MDKRNKIKVLILVLLGLSTAVISAQIFMKIPKESYSDKSKVVLLNYADNLLGNNMPLEGVSYRYYYSEDSGITWITSGLTTRITLADGLMPLERVDTADAYKIEFMGTYTDIPDMIWMSYADIPIEIEVAIVSISVSVEFEDTTPADFMEILVWYNDVNVANITTNVNGEFSFNIIEGTIAFTDAKLSSTVIVYNDVSKDILVVLADNLIIGNGLRNIISIR